MATLISQVKGIVTARNNNGVKVLWAIEACVDHMFQHKDWTPLAWLMAKMEPQDNSRVRKIVGEVVGGITLVSKGKMAKDQPSGLFIKMGANAGTTDKMEILRELVKNGETFRGKAVTEALLDREEKEFDPKAWGRRMLKKLDEEGYTIQQILALVADDNKIDVTKPERHDAQIKAA